MERGILANGDRVRLLKPSGNGKTFVAAGTCGTVWNVIKGGESVWVNFQECKRPDYIHPVDPADLEFESPLDKFTRGLA